SLFFFQSPDLPRALHSFPTRRSSDLQIILPLMLASVIADIVASSLMRESLMTEKLSRRGLRVRAEYEVDVFRTTQVRDVMTRDRSEEHTSELQSQSNLVCRLLLEKKK